MAIEKYYYGQTAGGHDVYGYTLQNAAGMRVQIIEYGCTVTELWTPDRSGGLRNVVLGYRTLQEYEQGTAGMGAFIGRYANRIENARFTLLEKEYVLTPNDGPNYLHGSLGHTVFAGCILSEDGVERLQLQLLSPDGTDGFPGNLHITVTYTLTDSGVLVMDYRAVSDMPTIVNFTNHSYFNLNGAQSRSVEQHRVFVRAREYCEGNEQTCPTGRILPVQGTVFDFRQEKALGKDLHSADPQLLMAKGYDHNFVLDLCDRQADPVAGAYSEESGIEMRVYTTQPGMQLYTGNYLSAAGVGQDGVPFEDYQAFCMETQHFPCTPSRPGFPSVVLMPTEEYRQMTAYEFRVR